MHFNIEETEAQRRATDIRVLLLDVDGVLTDGSLYFSNSGNESKRFNSLDGHGLVMLQKAGIPVGIITGRSSLLLERRATELGIELLFQGCRDKSKTLDEVLASLDLEPAQCAYVGDDLPDLPVLLRVGLGFAVANAHADVRSRVHAITSAEGGKGAIREICDYLLKSQNRYERFLPS